MWLGIGGEPTVSFGRPAPSCGAPCVLGGVGEFDAVQTIRVEVHHDRVTILDQRDGATQKRFRRYVADDEADGST